MSDSLPDAPPPRRPAPVVVPDPPAADGPPLDTLTAGELQARVDARERDLKYHVEAIKHEVQTAIDDVQAKVDEVQEVGRPITDWVREGPVFALGVTAAAGALVGMLLGLRKRATRRPERTEDHVEFVRARLELALDQAARRVGRGASVEQAMQASMATVPAVFGDVKAPTTHHVGRQTALDVALQTAVGFGVKTAMDLVIRHFSDSDGTFDALSDAVD